MDNNCRHIIRVALVTAVAILSALTCWADLISRNHLRNNRLDASVTPGQTSATIHQTVHYYPFGLPMDSTASPDYQRRLFGDKEFDRAHGLDLYDQAARLYDPTLGRFRTPDPLAEAFYGVSPYLFCIANPLLFMDKDGEKVEIYATKLPGAHDWIQDGSDATHTFILVTDKNGNKHRFAYGALEHPIAANIGIGGRLQSITYNQDTDIITGKNTDDLKATITVTPPKNMSEEEFDQRVIDVAKSFGNNEGIHYRIDGGSNTNDTYGNCNSSTSTILLKAGVSKEQIEKIKNEIPGKKWGFESTAKPWTKEEQQKAVDNRILPSLGKFHLRQ